MTRPGSVITPTSQVSDNLGNAALSGRSTPTPRRWRLAPLRCREFLHFFAKTEQVPEGTYMAASDERVVDSPAPFRGTSLQRREDECAAVEAITRGLLRAIEDGWSLEAYQPEGSYRGLWGKTFVRFFARDAQSA